MVYVKCLVCSSWLMVVVNHPISYDYIKQEKAWRARTFTLAFFVLVKTWDYLQIQCEGRG